MCHASESSFPLNQWQGASSFFSRCILSLGEAHMRSVSSLSSLRVALDTVPMFVWLNTDRSRPWRPECRPLPFFIPVSFRRSMVQCSGLSMFRKFLKSLSTSVLPSCPVIAVLASLSASSRPLTTAWPGTGILEADDCQVTTVFTVQRHSTIGTRQTQYHDVLPSSANVQLHLTSSFADDGKSS